MSENRSTPLFPKGCTCLSYGRGLTMTRVNSPYCPVHAGVPGPSISKGGGDGRD